VIEATREYYERDNASVHRGVHALSERATAAFDSARSSLRRFLNGASDQEIILTKGCTESLNLVASSYGRANLKPGDEILLTTMEHHSNIVPWQIVAEQTGAKVRPIPIDDRGQVLLDEFSSMLSERTKVVGIVHVSNALGTVNPVKQMAKRAHEAGAIVVVDGAQAGPHLPIDVRELGADFYSLSGHKMFGPTGVGILYGLERLLDAMPPYQGGGSMISSVSFEGTTYAELPAKFEAGTPNIAGMIGLGAAAEYLMGLGRERLAAYEHELTEHGMRALAQVDGVRLIGTADGKTSILSFLIDGFHPHDVGTVLDREGIAIRAGHHCTMPLMKRFGIAGTARASLALYSTRAEIDALVAGVRKVREVLS
jgi:cysteine desulfurase/selenocysteine lyase